MKNLLSLCLTLCSIFIMTATPASAEEKLPQRVEKIYDEVKALVLQHYPKAEVIRKENRIECKFNTRIFMIHYPLKTGEWQDANPTEGPNRGGVMCSISLSKGHWMGAAMVPQTFDYGYYSSTLMCPYNKKLDMHLQSHLNIPKGTSSDFATSYSKLIQSFATE